MEKSPCCKAEVQLHKNEPNKPCHRDGSVWKICSNCHKYLGAEHSTNN